MEKPSLLRPLFAHVLRPRGFFLSCGERFICLQSGYTVPREDCSFSFRAASVFLDVLSSLLARDLSVFLQVPFQT